MTAAAPDLASLNRARMRLPLMRRALRQGPPQERP